MPRHYNDLLQHEKDELAVLLGDYAFCIERDWARLSDLVSDLTARDPVPDPLEPNKGWSPADLKVSVTQNNTAQATWASGKANRVDL